MLVILDTNVLVSAILTPGGPPDVLLRSAETGQLDFVVSPLLLAELRRILLTKFTARISAEETGRFLGGLVVVGRLASDPPAGASRLTRDPDDDYLVLLARSTGAELLISGDKDLLSADLTDPVVITPTEAAERLGV